ncbi:hypothetical protein GCM10010399_90040 [Dactylosporangium fulvum]|uniref:Uncharacterized protein n=1 Tax=Dactylosporangium fulvum TaxID=53359 RepID=A0ABY5W9B8_9ACTN|nr:hypothetical protein [Dactylosporangium fulvum]UWP85681.1 hypothetical protein Dfulv_16140 [Dactylosporangium fulvum]
MAVAPAVHGRVAPGYEPIREEFARNLRDRDELGAASATVISSWTCGAARRTRPQERCGSATRFS